MVLARNLDDGRECSFMRLDVMPYSVSDMLVYQDDANISSRLRKILESFFDLLCVRFPVDD